MSHFVYDLWFYVDNADLPEALEFDVNQSFGGTRWIFGTECSLKDTGKWDVYDKGRHWVPTNVPCTHLSSTTWHHLIWQFERAGQQVHYISVTLDDNTSQVDMYLNSQSNFDGDGIDADFQMDGDSEQDAYTVWLDQVTLTEW